MPMASTRTCTSPGAGPGKSFSRMLNCRGAESSAIVMGQLKDPIAAAAQASLLKEIIKRDARIALALGLDQLLPVSQHWPNHRARGRAIPRHRHAGAEELALVGAVLRCDPLADRLGALETGRWLKPTALLTAVQRGVAFRTIAGEIDIRGQRGRATITARGRHVVDQPGQPRPGDVERRFRPLRGRLPVARGLSVLRASGIHVAVLPVLAVAIHGDKLLRRGLNRITARRLA